VASSLVPGSPAASRAGAGGGGEPVAARLVAGQLGNPEADELVQRNLADLAWGGGRVRELAEVLLDQVPQAAGPGRRGTPAAGGGLQHPPLGGGLLPRGIQGDQGGGQVPGREGLPGLVGSQRDQQNVLGRLGGDRRVRVLRGAGFSFPCGGAARGAGWRRRRRPRRRAGRRRCCRAGASADGARLAGPVAVFQVLGMPGRPPLARVAVPAFAYTIRAWRAAATLMPACPAIIATVVPPGSADRAARTAAAGPSPADAATGARAGAVAVLAGLRAVPGAASWCVPWS